MNKGEMEWNAENKVLMTYWMYSDEEWMNAIECAPAICHSLT